MNMDDKYRIMTLKYLYSLLDLKKYEKILEDNNIKSNVEGFDDFKYFSILSDGDVTLFTEEEVNEFISYDKYSIEEMLSNEELSNKIIDFIKKTYIKFYFSNTKGEYLYYNGISDENMVPDDAFALAINYVPNYNESDDFDTQREQIDDVIVDVINSIQFDETKGKNIKVAVIENNGLKLNDSILTK